MKSLFENWKTIPNLLSFLRIIMVPIMAALFVKGYPVWAVFVLFLSGLSDFFDGKIARRFNQISDLGKILDPLADKLTQITVAVLLYIFVSRATMPELKAFSWVFLLFVCKELFMVVMSVFLLSIGLRPGAAEIYGKVATFVFYGVMLLIIGFAPEIGAFRNFWTMPTLMLQILVVISAVLCFVALFSYVPGTYRLVRARDEEKKEEQEQR